MNDKFEDAKKGFVQRTSTLRIRTWTLTLSIVLVIAFYFMINVVIKDAMNWVDFVFLNLIQIIAQCTYFPDGELYGTKDERYVSWKKSYNDKANEITQNRLVGKLADYCKYDFNKRKKDYIINECGAIGITYEQLEDLKKMTPKEINKIDRLTIQDGKEERIVILTHSKKRRLKRLLFKDIPVEENNPDTILSAVENNKNKAIHDGSIVFKSQTYIKKFLIAFLIGLTFGYIGYAVRDGFGLAEVFCILTYLITLFTTAVTAFGGGETCSKVYKANFFINLSNFIDGFNEWHEKDKKVVKDEKP